MLFGCNFNCSRQFGVMSLIVFMGVVLTSCGQDDSGSLAKEKPVESNIDKGVSKFQDVVSLIEDFGDYSADAGTFKVISLEPLHIQVSPQVFPGDNTEVIKSLINRAVIYGVYRSYVHTPVEKITVTAIPAEVVDLQKREYKFLSQHEKTLSMTRQDAFHSIQKLIEVNSMEDLVVGTGVNPDSWTEAFTTLYYNDTQSGIKVLVADLESATSAML